jgi:hypothetical protein
VSGLGIAIIALSAAGLIWIAAPKVQSGNGEIDVNTQPNAKADAATYVGKSFEDAQADLGAPETQVTFTMSTGVQEFRIELRNIFDASDTPEIVEATWTQSPQQNLTLWFTDQDGTLRAVHYKTWHPDDEF